MSDEDQPADAKERVTAILSSPRRTDELMPLVYDELRALARRYMSRERRDHTLEPTALVHEAYLRLVDQTRIDWQGRSHFFAVGARVMRRLLVDHARGRRRAKRGGGSPHVTLVDAPEARREMDYEELLTLHDALDELARLDARQAHVVELRFFGGLSTDEIAEVVGVSPRTVQGDWAHARAWLGRELARRDESEPDRADPESAVPES